MGDYELPAIKCSEDYLKRQVVPYGEDSNVTELFDAVRKNDIGTVLNLVDSGIDVNIRNKFDVTAFIVACRYGHIEIAKLLLRKGADINATDYDNWTPLMWSIRWGSVEAVEFLLTSGADINIQSKAGSTALSLAEKMPVIVDLLKLHLRRSQDGRL